VSLFRDEYGMSGFSMALVTLLVASVVVGGALLLANTLGRIECRTRAEEMDLAWRFGFVAGCRVQIGDVYVPLENVRIVDGEPVIS
jgi:hypothetical protein